MKYVNDGNFKGPRGNIQLASEKKGGSSNQNHEVHPNGRVTPVAEPQIHIPLSKPVRPVFAKNAPAVLDKRSGPGRIIDVISKPARVGLAFMSGTSVDALDGAIVTITGRSPAAKVELVAFETFPYPEDLRKRIFLLFNPATARLDELTKMNFVLGGIVGQFALLFLEEYGLEPNDIDFIAWAGQTIWHDPEPTEFLIDGLKPIVTGSTYAIGEPAMVAQLTGILTVGNLRVRDVAAGGQGAPITPYADWVMLQDRTANRCIQNFGGTGNVSHVPAWPAPRNRVIAFDTGPANMINDWLAEQATGGKLKFDRDGLIAAQGQVHWELVRKIMEMPYFRREPPKSTGRELFGVQFARQLAEGNRDVSYEDLLATSTMLTAESAARAYRDFIQERGHRIDEVIVGGGGALNPTLMRMFRERLQAYGIAAPVMDHEAVGIPNQAKEAMSMAVIVDDALAGLVTNMPGATGGQPAILGNIIY